MQYFGAHEIGIIGGGCDFGCAPMYLKYVLGGVWRSHWTEYLGEGNIPPGAARLSRVQINGD